MTGDLISREALLKEVRENKTRSNRANNKAKYDKSNTKGFYIKLNKKTDSDIITLLSDVTNKQGYIKALIRRDLSSELGSEIYRHFEEG